MIQLPVHYKGEILWAVISPEDEDLTSYRWNATKRPRGFYVRRRDSNEGTVYLHRIILERKLGRSLQKSDLSDHKDRDTLNNIRSNVRLASLSQNRANCIIFKIGSLGVRKLSHGYQAQITTGGKRIRIGVFTTEEEAADAFRRKHVEIHGEFSPYFQEEGTNV